MNKLDDNIYDSIKDKYSNLLIPLISEKYDIFRRSHNTTFMNNSFDIKEIFETDNAIDNDKINALLTNHFDEMNENIINYIKTCIFVYWVKNDVYKVNKEIKEYFKCQDSKKAVCKFLTCFQNKIIEAYMDPNRCYDTMTSLKKLCTEIKNDLFKLNEAIKEFISYDYIYDLKLRDEILISSQIDICPYCGRQYITRFKDRSSSDLDHFYPKKYLPLIALSLYNFIPSCQICNSRFKNQHIKNILYPFKDGYDNNVKFSMKYLSSITELYPKISIQVKNISKDRKFETEEDLKLFHIDEVYQSHNDFISELLYRKHIYDNPRFREYVKKIVPNELSDEEINILFFGYSFDLKKDQKRLLAKLVNDIFYE